MSSQYFIILSDKAKSNFKAKLQAVALDARLFQSDRQQNHFFETVMRDYEFVARRNAAKPIAVNDDFFNLRRLISKLSTKHGNSAAEKLINNPSLLFEENGISLAEMGSQDSIVPNPSKKLKTKKRKRDEEGQITLDEVRSGIIHILKKNGGIRKKWKEQQIEPDNPLYGKIKSWPALNMSFRREHIGLQNTGYTSLFDFFNKDTEIQSHVINKISIDNVRAAVLYHLKHHNGRPPNTRTGVIEFGNPLHDGTRTWASVNMSFSRKSSGLQKAGFIGLKDFCERDEEVKNKIKPTLTIDDVRAAVVYHLKHHNGRPPNTRTGVIEFGNPLHDGTRTWLSINQAFAYENLGLKNTDFKSLSDFCKRDEEVKKSIKHTLTVDNVRAAVLYHLKHHNGRPPNTRTGVIESGNPLHDGKRTWISVDTALARGLLGLKNSGFKSLLDFCKRDETIQKCGFSCIRATRISKDYFNPTFNYAALIQTMVEHTNHTKTQPDENDDTPIRHGPMANGYLSWKNIAFALKQSDERLAPTNGEKIALDLNTLFEDAVLSRSDVTHHFSLPLPRDMKDKGREKQFPPLQI